MTDPAALLDALEAAARALPDVDAAAGADGARTWTRAGVPFASARGAVVELRVGIPIGAAAIRTPNTRASARGADWIEFEPAGLDGHALDRLGAWVAAAHRRATS